MCGKTVKETFAERGKRLRIKFEEDEMVKDWSEKSCHTFTSVLFLVSRKDCIVWYFHRHSIKWVIKIQSTTKVPFDSIMSFSLSRQLDQRQREWRYKFLESVESNSQERKKVVKQKPCKKSVTLVFKNGFVGTIIERTCRSGVQWTTTSTQCP